MPRFTVVQSEHLSPEPAAWLAERINLVVCPYDDPAFSDALSEADGLIVRTYTGVDAALLRKAPRLKVVGRAGVALENIDLDACGARGVEVVHAPGSNTQAVVEYVLALLLDALRPRQTTDQPLSMSAWNKLRAATFARRQLNELTLGILGFGRIGSRLAAVADAIGCRVRFHDIRDVPAAQHGNTTPVDLQTLFAESDVISLHIDSRQENRGFVDRTLLSLMKPNVILLNTSRGFILDNDALRAFLQNHPDALAVLDVHDPEPFDASYPLLELPNARLLPHLAGRTETAMTNMSWVVRDVLAVLEGRPPEFPAPRPSDPLSQTQQPSREA